MACKCENVTHPLKMNGFGDKVVAQSELLHLNQRLQVQSQIRSLESQIKKLHLPRQPYMCTQRDKFLKTFMFENHSWYTSNI